MADEVRIQNVRKCLYLLRQKWDAHSPASPFCLCDEVEPGITFSQFCVSLMISQRARRSQISLRQLKASKKEEIQESTLNESEESDDCEEVESTEK